MMIVGVISHMSGSKWLLFGGAMLFDHTTVLLLLSALLQVLFSISALAVSIVWKFVSWIIPRRKSGGGSLGEGRPPFEL